MSTEKKQAYSGVPAKIADELRARIARGALGPGMRLGQTELAAQFEASRVPVREALKLLSSEGLIEHDPNRGFFVAQLSSDEARQLFRMRDLIEDELLKTVVWPEARALKALTQHAAKLDTLLDKGERLNWWSENREFHNLVFELSPNKIMVREAMRLWALTDRFRAILPLPRRPGAARDVVEKNYLVDALSKRDMKQLLAVRRERRRAFEQMVLETLEDRGL
ncbi:GntR family transcriptional regulator [Parasphingopyxis marina]|uniref:GntR family transcriptional regulator n=1 Tax=Parasphingopyxis marina TaxID=2761622 RepID=UPI0022A719C8|nr:GntR family transcriptional regulator [Parasphingopyxis marina]